MLLTLLREQERVLLLPCGIQSIRFRPALTITQSELAVGCKAIGRSLDRLAAQQAARTPDAGPR